MPARSRNRDVLTPALRAQHFAARAAWRRWHPISRPVPAHSAQALAMRAAAERQPPARAVPVRLVVRPYEPACQRLGNLGVETLGLGTLGAGSLGLGYLEAAPPAVECLEAGYPGVGCPGKCAARFAGTQP